MKQYRYVVNGRAGTWKNLVTTIEFINYVAETLNEYFDDWYIEYREGDEENVSI